MNRSNFAFNDELIDDLRRSINSSLMFDHPAELRANHTLEADDSFTQIKVNRKSISFLKKRKDTDYVCRICLDSEDTENRHNPLISPCKCTGSMKDVHLECLKVWIQNKRNTRDHRNTRSFNWK